MSALRMLHRHLFETSAAYLTWKLAAHHSLLLLRLHAPRLQPGRQQHLTSLVCHAEKAVEDMLVLELKEELKLRQLPYAGRLSILARCSASPASSPSTFATTC